MVPMLCRAMEQSSGSKKQWGEALLAISNGTKYRYGVLSAINNRGK
ncbi:MAG: hypothetical protein RR137_08835 [Odoribacter sp.]